MILDFAEPQWFLLLPVLVVAGWRLRKLGLDTPLRAVCAGLLVLSLADPRIRQSANGLDLWVLVDRSSSAAESFAAKGREQENILSAGASNDDRLFFVDFAEAPVLREPGTAFEPSPHSSALRLATEFALASRDKNRPARILALTDGLSTDSLTGLETSLRSAGIALDLRFHQLPAGEDFRTGAITAPLRVAAGQNFLLEAPIYGTSDLRLPYEVLCDGVRIGSGHVDLRGGRGHVRVAGTLTSPGARRYEIRVLPTSDVRPGNNAATHWVEVQSSGSVLVVSGYPDDPLPDLLAKAGFSVEKIDDPQRLHPGALSGPRTVLLNNIPASSLPSDFLAAMDFFIREQGGGLLMTGGRQSFGSGGYFESPLDPLLPVSMELRQEHRKLAVAMAIVMDRSGSMAAAVDGKTTKMDLANEGAARAIELLGPADAITVFAVDSEPHEIIPLSQIGKDAKKIGAKVRSIESSGGGIFVHVGLSAAWKELQKSEAGQRHIILFSDAADSEEPGDYAALLSDITSSGATLSVIALGSNQDTDAALLEDIARLGNGRIFFNADPNLLPGLFAQETVSVARSAFLDSPVPVLDAGGWPQISPRPISWLSQVDGYNLCYARPDASVGLLSGDEYRAPLLAFWQRGAGRTAAVTFPVVGKNSESFRAWSESAAWLQTLTRWLMPGPPPPGTSLKTAFEGNDLRIDFEFDEQLTGTYASSPPRLLIASGASGKPRQIDWQKIENGRFTTRLPVPAGEWIRGVVQLQDTRISFGPLAPGSDPEWQESSGTLRTLREISRLSGGQEISDLREAWRNPPTPNLTSLRIPLMILLLALLLIEIAFTRWQGKSL